MDLSSTSHCGAIPWLLITGPDLAATLIRPRLGLIQDIHGWKLGAVGVAPWPP
jgi:hypothetical protein